MSRPRCTPGPERAARSAGVRERRVIQLARGPQPPLLPATTPLPWARSRFVCSVTSLRAPRHCCALPVPPLLPEHCRSILPALLLNLAGKHLGSELPCSMLHTSLGPTLEFPSSTNIPGAGSSVFTRRGAARSVAEAFSRSAR